MIYWMIFELTLGTIVAEPNVQTPSLNEGFVKFGSVADAILGMVFHTLLNFSLS